MILYFSKLLHFNARIIKFGTFEGEDTLFSGNARYYRIWFL